MEEIFGNQQTFFVRQFKEWIEIALDFETRNTYEILDDQQHKWGLVAEKGTGLWKSIARLLLGSHRLMEVKVWDSSHKEILHINRPFYLFFSSMKVSCNGREVGRIEKRFSLLYKNCDIVGTMGAIIGHIKPPVWDLGIFPIFDRNLCKIGEISKKCHGWGSWPLLWPRGFVSI